MVTAMEVEVCGCRALTAGIREICLVSVTGQPLPGFTPGAHIKLATGVGSEPQWRAYSLIDLDGEGSEQPQAAYRIAVQREEAGLGGSRWVHEHLKIGSRVQIQLPVNHFPLELVDDVVLLGGGIGITPIISMASALQQAGRRFTFHYCARSADQAVYLARLQARFAGHLHVHWDAESHTQLSLDALLDQCGASQPLYVCGPTGLIQALRGKAEAAGWAPQRLRFELFGATPAPAAPVPSDSAFEVELRDGRVLPVPAHQSLLQVLQAHGVDLLSDCHEGYCGLCSVEVLEGQIDHRDAYLSAAEQGRGRVMQSCVSRARGRLKLNV